MTEIVDGVDVYELIIPLACFAICIAFQGWEFVGSHNDRARARVLFSKVRSGWVLNNYMKGTVAVNTTRDYIKSAVFFANSSITLATFTVGYAGSRYTDCVDDDCTTQNWLLIIKLGVLAIVLLCIFFVFTQCTRFAVHFSFCINTKELEGMLIPKSLLENLFDHTYKYYSLGIRLYFGTIPVFAWILHVWVLVVVTPFYLFMVRGLETADFVQADLEEIEMLRQAAELPPTTATAAAAAAGPAAVAPGEEEEESVVVVPQADKRL